MLDEPVDLGRGSARLIPRGEGERWEAAPEYVGAYLDFGAHFDGTDCGGAIWWWHPEPGKARWTLVAIEPLELAQGIVCPHPLCVLEGRIVGGRWRAAR